MSRECLQYEISQSEKIWEKYLHSSYHPQFDIDHNQFVSNHEKLIEEFPLSISEKEIKEEIKWIFSCRELFPNYKDDQFIYQSIEKYKEFLFEMQLNDEDSLPLDGPVIFYFF